MAKNKTTLNETSVDEFLNKVESTQKRADSEAIVKLMRAATGHEPAMWGTSIIGFGSYHYIYESGREGDAPLVGFSPRKQALTLYVSGGFDGYDELMTQLGKYKTGKVCIYVKKLADVDTDILAQLVKRSAEHMQATNH